MKCLRQKLKRSRWPLRRIWESGLPMLIIGKPTATQQLGGSRFPQDEAPPMQNPLITSKGVAFLASGSGPYPVGINSPATLHTTTSPE